MKIAIIGYGKMGKSIEKVAQSRGHEIVVIIDKDSDWLSHKEKIQSADVAIEFSIPEKALENIQNCFQQNLPIVVGTTGWHQHSEEIKRQCEEEGKKLIFASNFSIGVNLFFNLNEQLAKLINPYSEYNVEMNEIHHTQKLDAPSGTAISLANDIIKQIDRKNDWSKEQNTKDDELLIESQRTGDVIGTHIITYESDIDKIEIKHEAKNRNGFAIGAVIAAEKTAGITGFHEFKDLIL